MQTRAGQLKKLVVFAVAAAIAGVFSINFCALVYSCGCHALWAGATAQCNIHLAHGRHCPWCLYGGRGFYVALLSILGLQLAASFWPGSLSLRWRFLVALAAFPVLGGAIAVIQGIISGYWS